ncbi:GntR family transcriptional regulator [Priestia abyssalis]|uniref:GntR family transcriptional regulator n=1 Tax=Priestia abyssalis TaxID=1221450 RepID=UPI00111700C7|nr:GntR family transcriptional regulator [Priestia abyssalis]
MLRKLKQPDTLANQAYRSIKKAIIQGTFSPHEQLAEEHIASILGISRTPIREAMNRLAYEGLLEIEKGKKARVAAFTEHDHENFLELRQLLEPHNVWKLAANISSDTIRELEHNLLEQLQAIQEKNLYAFIDKDMEFHLLLTKGSENHKLGEFIEQLNTNLNRRFLILSGSLESSAHEAYSEHLSILEALKERNQEAAKERMIHHITQVEERVKLYQIKEEIE